MLTHNEVRVYILVDHTRYRGTDVSALPFVRYTLFPLQKELLKKIRAKIKEQNQYEKQRKMEIKMAEKRKKMEEKIKRRQEREAAKGPRPSGLRQVDMKLCTEKL